MRLTVDLDSLELITSAGDRKRVPMKEFKRGDATPLEVQFVRSGVAEALPEGAVLAFGMKESKKYDGDFAVFFDEFAAPTATPDFIYAGSPNFNTEELNDLLFVDDSTSNDKAFVDLMGELSWSVDEADPVSIRTFTARVHNDVIRGTEGTPLATPTPIDWLAEHGIVFDPTITALTGGGAGKLDGIAVTAEDADQLRAVRINDTVYTYALHAADLAESSPTIINVDSDPDALSWVLQSQRVNNLIAAAGVSANTFTAATAVEIGGSEAGQVALYNPVGLATKAATLKASTITDDREHELPDRDGTLLPFIEIAANISDNAGIAEVAADTLGLVVRNQDTDDWHQITLRDSGIAAGGAASGIPTFSISDPL